MLEWYLGFFFSDCKDISVMLEVFKTTWWFLTSHWYFNQTHLNFFGAFMVLNFLNKKKKVTQSKRYLLGNICSSKWFQRSYIFRPYNAVIVNSTEEKKNWNLKQFRPQCVFLKNLKLKPKTNLGLKACSWRTSQIWRERECKFEKQINYTFYWK